MSRRSGSRWITVFLPSILAAAGITLCTPQAGSPEYLPQAPVTEVVSDRLVFQDFREGSGTALDAPRVSPNGRFAVFESIRDGEGAGLDVRVGHVVDREQNREVAHLAASRFQWTFLNGGKRIAYWWYDNAGGAGLRALELASRSNGGPLAPLDTLGGLHVSSPDDDKALDQLQATGPLKVRRRDVYPRPASAQTNGELYGHGLSWNPATDEIACWRQDTRDWSVERSRGIYAIRMKDGRARRLLPSGWSPIWSPNGRKLAYEKGVDSQPPDVRPQVWVAQRDGSGRREVGKGRLLGWSSEGAALLVLRDAPSPTQKATTKELVRRSIDGSEERILLRLPQSVEGTQLEPSPSRRWLALREGNGLLLINTHSRRQLRVPLIGHSLVRNFHWGTDESTFYYASRIGRYETEWREVRIRPLEGRSAAPPAAARH